MKSYSHYKIYKSAKGGYYSFTTKNNTTYRCFFAKSITSNDLLGLTLKSPVFIFSFGQKDESGKVAFDPQTGKTIAEILNRFFKQNPDAIIGYICDNMDKKAVRRQMCFENWFVKNNLDPKKAFIKVDLVDIIYAGAILLSSHPDRTDIENYFKQQLEELQATDKTGFVGTLEDFPLSVYKS